MELALRSSALALAALSCAAASASAQVPAAQREVVAATGYFRFHSDALYNLHDLLTWRTSGLPSAPIDRCGAASPADWLAFTRAQQLYASKRGQEHNGFILAMRFEVAGSPGLGIQPDSVVAPALAMLDAALPAYRACWWEEHDRRNRAWIAQLLPRLHQHEDSIAARLARLYHNDWEKPFPVDVVSFASSTGASTIVEPHHINISAVDSSYRGGLAQRGQTTLPRNLLRQRGTDPRTERCRAARRDGLLACLDQVRIHGDREAFLTIAHTIVVT